jgi:preprotein translocase subunit SecG
MTIVFGYVLPLVHVLACLFLIVVVLLQTGKGADVGAVLGGGSQTFFGASGAGNLLTKLTTGMAITFMTTSLIIAVGQREQHGSSLVDRLPDAPVAAPAPAVPAPPAPQADAAAPAAAENTAANAVPAPAAGGTQAEAPTAAAPAGAATDAAPAPTAPAEQPAAPAPAN